MKIYTGDTLTFNNNGLGFLTDALSCNITDEINGAYELNMEYPVNGKLAEYLVEENIIKCKVADGTEQLFRIKIVKKDLKVLYVNAQHIFYDLLNNFLDDVYPQSLNCLNYVNHILANTNFATQFTAYSDIASIKTGRYVRRNPVEAIMGDLDNSVLNLFGGELKRDNFTINVLARVGQNNGVKLIFGKNITGIDITIDITEMATRIMPQGFDGLFLPEKYVDSPLISNYPTPKVAKIEFDDVKYDPDSTDPDVYTDINDAYNALRAKAQEQFTLGIDKPRISINIDWIELSKTNEYIGFSNLEKVNIGDTITANLLGLDYETRVIATNYDVLKDMITNFQIGTFHAAITRTINKIINDVDETLPTTLLEQAQANATELITSAMGGYIYKTESELFIMNTNDPSTATKVWRWNLNGLGYSNNGINGPYEIAMTMDGSIVANFITTGVLNTNVIQGYDSLTLQVQGNTDAIGNRTGKTSTITQELDSIEAQISDIADITASATTDLAVINDTEFQNIAASFPIRIEINAINDNISYLYPRENLFPSDTLVSPVRTLRFTNTSTNEVFDYDLPDDLLYYDADNYDTFVADYGANLCQIVKKCEYAADGSVSLLVSPTTQTYNFADEIEAHLNLTEGDYQVELVGYTFGHLFVRLMCLNAYTAQYATKVELNSAITQTAEEINLEVSRKVDADEVVSTINQSADQITITGNRFVVNASNFELTANGDMTSTSGLIGGWHIESNKLYCNIQPPYDYTNADLDRITGIIDGSITPTQQDYDKYDINQNGEIDLTDLLICQKCIVYDLKNTNPGKLLLDTTDWFRPIKIINSNGELLASFGVNGVYTKPLS